MRIAMNQDYGSLKAGEKYVVDSTTGSTVVDNGYAKDAPKKKRRKK